MLPRTFAMTLPALQSPLTSMQLRLSSLSDEHLLHQEHRLKVRVIWKDGMVSRESAHYEIWEYC